MHFFAVVWRKPGQPRHRRLPLHAGVQPRPLHARVPGADDSLPAPALERQPQGHAGAAVLAAGGGGALLEAAAGRRHEVADGAGLDRQGAGDPRHHLAGAKPGRKRAGGGAGGWQGAEVPKGEEGHPHAGQQPGWGGSLSLAGR